MKKFSSAIFILFFLPPVFYSQTNQPTLAASYPGLGAYSKRQADVFSFTINLASLAQLKNSAAGVYTERKFFLGDLNYYLFAAGMPVRSANAGIMLSYSGVRGYNETRAGIAYARRLGTTADLGIQFNYNGISIAGYGKVSAISADLGIILHLTDKLNAGIQVCNPVGGKFTKDLDEKLPAVYLAGFGYEASDQFFISAEIRKEEKQPFSVNAGFQYKFIPLLCAKGGIVSAASLAWMGLGFTMKSFRIDITTSFHPQLGITPGLLFLLEFNKKKNA